MKYFHDCGGIHAAGPAWDDFGWECVGISEIEKFPIAVVQHHYPNLKQHGDTTKVSLDGANLDLLIGGTPCQGFSVAGKRGGLDDKRSNLAWNFLRLAAESRARWIIWENVPGASSTNEGQDLLAFFGQVEKLGYGFCSRTLDAQYFGVPQRRRRIFLVGYFGDWRPAAAVLFERQSLSRNPPPSRKTRQGATRGFEIGSGANRESEIAPTLDARCKDGPIRNQIGMAIAHPLTAGENRQADASQENYITEFRRIFRNPAFEVYDNHAQDSRIKQVEVCPQLNAKDGTGGNNLPIVFTHKDSWLANGTDVTPTLQAKNHDKSHANDSSSLAVFQQHGSSVGPMGTLRKGNGNVQSGVPFMENHGTVRRLTPNECARLMGFPDNYCKIPWRGKPAELCPDGPQYKAYGNSIHTGTLRWIGNRIIAVERTMILVIT